MCSIQPMRVLHGVQAYQKAINAAVGKLREEEGEVHALELGCGTGLLSVMAAKAGATSVVACDMHDALCVATRKASTLLPRPLMHPFLCFSSLSVMLCPKPTTQATASCNVASWQF